MTLKDLIAPLQTLAPMVATALGGPLAGMAVRTLSNAVLGTPDGTEDQIAQAISTADPEVYLKVKQAEQDFAVAMKKLELEGDQIAMQDRDSARQREVTTKDKTPALLALAAFAGFFGILTALIFVEIPPASEQPLNIMLGALGGMVLSIITYYFGSSKGSADKNSIIQTFIKQKN